MLDRDEDYGFRRAHQDHEVSPAPRDDDKRDTQRRHGQDEVKESGKEPGSLTKRILVGVRTDHCTCQHHVITCELLLARPLATFANRLHGSSLQSKTVCTSALALPAASICCFLVVLFRTPLRIAATAFSQERRIRKCRESPVTSQISHCRRFCVR